MGENFSPTSAPIENKEKNEQIILLAEDDIGLGPLFVKVLEREGYKVELVEDGQALKDTILEKGEHYYSLVITDHNMPKMDGLDVIEIIREDGRLM